MVHFGIWDRWIEGLRRVLFPDQKSSGSAVAKDLPNTDQVVLIRDPAYRWGTAENSRDNL